MKYPWREDGRRDIYEGSRFIAVFDRTKPKPRPEGYRDHKLSRINSEWVQAGWSQGESGIPSLAIPSGALLTWYEANPEPVEALEPSQTGEVPPEPSKGRVEAAGGVETASSLEVGSAEWIRSHQKRYLESWGYHWNL